MIKAGESLSRKVDTGFILAFLLVPWVAVGSTVGMALLFILLAVGMLAADFITRRGMAVSWPLILASQALPVWALLTSIWSLDAVLAVKRAVIFGLISVGVIYLAWRARLAGERTRRMTAKFIGAGCVVVCVLLLSEGISNGRVWSMASDLFGLEIWRSTIYSRALCILVLFSVLTAVGCWRHGMPFLAVFVAATLIAAVSVTDSGTALVGLAMACGGGVLVWCVPARILSPVVAGGVFLSIASAPWLFGSLQYLFRVEDLQTVPFSAKHRLGIWNFVAERIAERPVLGWGMDSSRNVPGGKEELFHLAEALPLHPHNFALQIWLELGGVGALILAALAAYGASRLGHVKNKAAQVAGLVTMITYLGMAMVNYGVWQSWWLSSVALTIVLWNLYFSEGSQESAFTMDRAVRKA